MTRSMKAFVVAMLMVLPLATSCVDTNSTTGPEVATEIQRQDGLIGDLVDTTVDLLGSAVKLLSSILSGPDANGDKATAWIGPDGGTITTAAYKLTVPKGAVKVNTQFVVEPENNGTYTVNLSAYEKRLLGLVSVGENGFHKPVLLTISFANADGVTNEKTIGIIYIESVSEVELQSTTVDTKKDAVTAKLNHFSKYAMVQN